MINNYAGTCNVCRTPVAARAGTCDKVAGRWATFCLAHSKASGPVHTGRTLRAKGDVLVVAMAYEADAVALLRSLPGAKFDRDGGNVWLCSAAAGDRARVLEVADRLGLDVAAELRVKAADLDANTGALVEAARGLGAFEYQLDGVSFLASRKRALLADDMGLGKTFQTLRALPANGRVLCVVPASLKYTWRAEAARWRPDYTVAILSGRGSFRLPVAGEIVVVNYDILPDEAAIEALASELGDVVVVVDEAHRVKSHKAARSKRVAALVRASGRSIALTGTPLLGKPFDLWGTLNSCGMAFEVFGSWTRFLNLFGGSQNRWGGYDFADKPAPEAAERLRRVMLRRLKADVLTQLPAKLYRTIECNDLPADLVRDLDTAWEDMDVGDELPPFSAFSAIRARLAASRIPAMLDLVGDFEEAGKPLVVFSAHRAPVDELAGREGWAVITGDTAPEARQGIVDRFQAGQLLGVALTIAAGGVGLTLTRASDVLFVDLDWTPANNQQAEDRLHRIGQKGNVTVTQLVSAHVLDIHVQNLLAAKARLIEGAIEAEVSYDAKAAETAWVARAAAAAQAQAVAVAAAAQATRDYATRRINGAVAREAKKSRVETATITAAIRAGVARGLEAVASVCDGAQTRDGEGFNKADTSMGHWLATSELGTEEAVRLGWAILRRYPRQVRGVAPELFE